MRVRAAESAKAGGRARAGRGRVARSVVGETVYEAPKRPSEMIREASERFSRARLADLFVVDRHLERLSPCSRSQGDE